MRTKKMLNLLKEATEKYSHLYDEDELKYMKEQLIIIDSELKKVKHKDYKGFGKK